MLDGARIVVLAPNWLGDAVMALPAIADVRRGRPDAHVTVAARGGLAPLYRAAPAVDAVVALEGRHRKGRTHDVAVLKGRFDNALLLPNSFHAAWLVWRAGIGERYGYAADWRSWLLTHRAARPKGGRLHQAEYYQRLTEAFGVEPGPLRPELVIDGAADDAAIKALSQAGWSGERLVGFAPGAAYGTAKRWLPERAGALAARVAAEHGVRPVIVGAQADMETASLVVGAAERAGLPAGAALNLAGRTTLPALMGVMARCAAFLSNDSGAMHLAAALGVPVTAIFGPTREWATSPLPAAGGPEPSIVKVDVFCRPCMLRTCPIDHRCMTRITVEQVLEPVARGLRPDGAAA